MVFPDVSGITKTLEECGGHQAMPPPPAPGQSHRYRRRGLAATRLEVLREEEDDKEWLEEDRDRDAAVNILCVNNTFTFIQPGAIGNYFDLLQPSHR